MAIELALTEISYPAGADLSLAQYKLVKIVAGLVQLCAAGEKPVGVLTNNPTLGQVASIAICGAGGIAKVVAGAVVAADAIVAADANGAGVTSVTVGHVVAGTALTAAAAAGEVIEVLLETGNVV